MSPKTTETLLAEERFGGFSPTALDWLVGIGLENSREWFLAHRDAYEGEVKGPFVALLAELAEVFGGTPKVFRPNRDVRFSADKRPYKTNVSGYLDGTGPTFYLALSDAGLFAATGYYGMAGDQLERYRAALVTGEDSLELGAALRAIVEREGVEGERLKTAPRGIAKDAPNLDLLRFKSLTISGLAPFDELGRERCLAHAAGVWRRGEALNVWLDAHVGRSVLEARR